MFDWSLVSTKSGGFVTDSWIHMALSVTSGAEPSVRMYVDGRRLDSMSDRMDGLRLRDLTGDRLRMEITDDMTRESSMEACSNYCKAAGYNYMGLEWTRNCNCDNDYGSFTKSTAENPGDDGYGTCDIDGDGLMDCGFNNAVPEGAYNISRDRSCGWRNAVFDIKTAEPIYKGCYLDGQRPSRCEDATTCEVCALMADMHCGWSSRRGQCRDGSRTTPSECSVSEYGFPLNSNRAEPRCDRLTPGKNPCFGTECDGQGDGPCGCDPCPACVGLDQCPSVRTNVDRSWYDSDSDKTACEAAGCDYVVPGFWSWTESPENVLWPDPTKLAENATLKGFTLDEVYQANDDFTRELMLPVGDYFFVGLGGGGNGWHDGTFQVLDGQGNVLVEATTVDAFQAFKTFAVTHQGGIPGLAREDDHPVCRIFILEFVCMRISIRIDVTFITI